MFNEITFRQVVEDMISNPDSYSKEAFYDAFLDMTERYLNEMVTSMNLENALVEGMEQDVADELIEKIVTANPGTVDLDKTNALENDRVEAILNLFAYIEIELGNHSIGGDDNHSGNCG